MSDEQKQQPRAKGVYSPERLTLAVAIALHTAKVKTLRHCAETLRDQVLPTITDEVDRATLEGTILGWQAAAADFDAQHAKLVELVKQLPKEEGRS